MVPAGQGTRATVAAEEVAEARELEAALPDALEVIVARILPVAAAL